MSTSEHPDLDINLWRKRPLVQEDGVWKVEGRPRTTYKLLDVRQPSNIPGRVFVAILVTVPPKAATPPHTHNQAAVFGQVTKGRVVSQMIHSDCDGKEKGASATDTIGIYGPGEMWYEQPGCRHVRSENASDTEEAQFFANFVIEESRLNGLDEKNLVSALTILDVDPRSPHYNEASARNAG